MGPQTGAERLTLRNEMYVRACAVSPMGDSVVSGSFYGTLKLWDTKAGAERLTLRDHGFEVMGCAVSPMGDYIVSIWSMENSRCGTPRQESSGSPSKPMLADLDVR